MKNQTFSEWIDQLKSRVGIVELVGSYVSLERKGSRYWACCPFHHEKTPSFTVDESRNSYHCFGCHVGGDCIRFVMDIENVDFMSACKLLAKRVGMEMPEFKSRRDGSQDVRRKKERLYEMMKDAARYYRSNFDGKEGAPAREYLAGRGIGENTARAFGIGYSTGYRGLVTKLKSLGYLEIEMVEAGLVDQRDGDVYDAMAGRLIVPIIDGMKRIIAFGGRVLVKDKLPKYKNTRDTILFDKSNELFGQDTVKRLRMTQPVNDLIVVEGYMDVISLWQAGVKNAVASMGTALTQRQAAILKRYCDKVYICYDGDAAGQKATVRGLDILHSQGLDVRVVSLPEGLDPDEFVRKYGADGYIAQLVKAKPLYEFKLSHLAEGYDMSVADEQGKYVVAAVAVLKELKNPAQMDAYIPLVAKLSKLSEQTVRRQLMSGGDFEATATDVKRLSGDRKDGVYYKAMRYVLYALCGGLPDAKLDEDLSPYMEDNDHVKIYDEIRKGEMTTDDLSALAATIPEAERVLAEGRKVSEKVAEVYFGDCLNKLHELYAKKERKLLLESYNAETDPIEKAKILERLNKTKTK